MALPEDIVAKVRQDFPEDDALVILQLLAEVKQSDPKGWHGFDRVLRCIVFVADGSFERFAAAVYTDARDLIVSAEYDGWSGEEHHVRNFELPFSSNVA